MNLHFGDGALVLTGEKVLLTLPFPLLFTSVIHVTGGVNRDIFVGGGLEGSVGRFRLDVAFDAAAFPDGAATLPRTLELGLTIGAQGFPGEASLGEADLEADDDEWEAEEDD